MSSVNKAILIGRLGNDPEIRHTKNNTAIATLSVATSERFKDAQGVQQERTEWHRVVAWSRLAEICQQYLRKGSLIYIEGSIQTNQWEDKDGKKRYTTEIVARQMTMLDGKGDQQPQPNAIPSNFNDLKDDLPFIWLLLLVPSMLGILNMVA